MVDLLVQMLTQDILWNFFYGSMAPKKDMLDVSNSHDDGDHIGVLNLIEIFFTTALVTRVNVQV